jgi:hypothetical protein
MALRCSGEALVACEQRGLKGFRESHIDRVISREVVAQVPNPSQKYIVWVPLNWIIGEIIERRAAALVLNFP